MPRCNTVEDVKDENQDPDESILPDSDDRLKKKEAYMRDFAIQVENKVKAMESYKKGILADLERLSKSNFMKIKKEIRQMTLTEFEERGGDLATMDLKEISTIAIGDTSFAQNSPDNATIMGSNAAGTGGGRRKKVLMHTSTKKQYFEDPPPAQIVGGARYTRERTVLGDKETPIKPGRKRITKKQQSILIDFDPTKFPSSARSALGGETLVSLKGSPVVAFDTSSSRDDTQLFSVSGNPGETVFLGGKVFMEEGMSPNTRYEMMNVISKAVNQKMEELNSVRLDSS